MAVTMKKMDFAASVKQRLSLLDYQEIEDMDEVSVAELLLNPGEGRLKALEWLFSRYDEALEELLNISKLSLGSRTESRLQRLLTAACSMCLCQADDIDLIKGEGSLSRQIYFIDKLLDLVCIREQNNLSNPSMKQTCDYIDTLVSQDGFINMFEFQVDLLPKDIHSEVEKVWIKDGWNRDRAPPVPSLQDLVTRSDKLATDLSQNTLLLEQLLQQVMVQDSDKDNELLNKTHMLATVLKELHQLAEGFLYCYENQISQWCHQMPTELSELGPVFKRVHSFLHKFVTLLENLAKLRQVQTKLNKTARNESDIRSQVLAEATRETSDTFQHCLTVLEEALHRTKSSFCSRYTPVISL